MRAAAFIFGALLFAWGTMRIGPTHQAVVVVLVVLALVACGFVLGRLRSGPKQGRGRYPRDQEH